MNNNVKAKIYWISEKNGGRKNIPNSRNYSTVACFEDIKDQFSTEAWSVVIDLENAQKESNWVIADFRFLVESAPCNLLYTGSKFQLFEGRRLVAIGEIL
ncbi:MAG TPA: hypothetical protein PLA01_09895 [Acetivibrio sp.]|jgi:hypothetical protein|nr:hypothetical protein [Acetivibrio sp.]